jgi:hypothetical protein
MAYEHFLEQIDNPWDFISTPWLKQKECLAIDVVFAVEAVISVFLSYRFDRLELRDLFFAATAATKRFQSV